MVLWPLEEEDEEDNDEEEEEAVAASGVCGLDFAPDLSSLVLDSAEEAAAEASADERAATAAISAAVMGTRMRPLGSEMRARGYQIHSQRI